MKVLVSIGGREAIPIRAIPFLTNWEVLSPDVIAEVLAGESDYFRAFLGLRAYRMEKGHAKVIAPSFWENCVLRDLRALSDRTRRKEVTHEDGYSHWRSESFLMLPAGAFVWRDEFESRFWKMYGPDGETVAQANTDGELVFLPRHKDIKLDFEPFIPTASVASLVMEGLGCLDSGVEDTPDETTLVQIDSSKLGVAAEATSIQVGEVTPEISDESSPTAIGDVRTNVLEYQPNEVSATAVVELTKGYIMGVMREARWTSAKELFRELLRRADQPNSPFLKGTGHSLGKLYVPELNKTLSEGTLRNALPRLRNALK